MQHGRPLPDVLEEFMADVMAARADGGRLCAHHLEFDAGIILRELRRCGLVGLAAAWAAIATDGFCTMNVDLCDWALPLLARERQGSELGKRFLQLGTVAAALQIPDCIELLEQHHEAGADAMAAAQIYAAVLQYAASSQ